MREIKAGRVFSALGVIVLGSLSAGSSSAAAASGKFAGYCLVEWAGEAIYNSSVFQSDKDDRDHWKWEFMAHLIEIGERKDSVHSPHCRLWDGAEALESAREAEAEQISDGRRMVRFKWVPKDIASSGNGDAIRPVSTSRQPRPPVQQRPSKAPPAPSKYVEVAGPNGMIRLSPEVATRNQAAADDYRRKMDAFARAKAEHERTLALHQQSQANAAAEQEAYQREVAAAAERVAAYKIAMADHSKKLATASTNDDPNTCITRPEFRSNDGLAGNTSASVINGCPQKVDIVLCLKRTTGDWTCGAKFGILTQGKMTYASRDANGEIFVDAISYGGGGKLKRPDGM